MRYLTAFLLAVSGGKEKPTADDLKKIVEAVGGEFDEEKANKCIKAFEGKNLEEMLEAGLGKLGGVGGGSAGSGAAAGGEEDGGEAEAEEEEEEESEGGGLGIFGGGSDSD